MNLVEMIESIGWTHFSSSVDWKKDAHFENYSHFGRESELMLTLRESQCIIKGEVFPYVIFELGAASQTQLVSRSFQIAKNEEFDVDDFEKEFNYFSNFGDDLMTEMAEKKIAFSQFLQNRIPRVELSFVPLRQTDLSPYYLACAARHVKASLATDIRMVGKFEGLETTNSIEWWVEIHMPTRGVAKLIKADKFLTFDLDGVQNILRG